MTARTRSAFTIIELVVVILIITLLIAILLPIVNRARGAGYLAVCASNLHQIGVFVQSYAADNNHEIPAFYGEFDPGSKPKPTSNFSFLVTDETQGVKLLVNAPIGLAQKSYATDASIFMCPGDYELTRTSSADFGYRHDRRYMSYDYWYVPSSGDLYLSWRTMTDPGSHWFPAFCKGLERHNIDQPKASSPAILVERPVHPRWDGDSFHPGDGGNVLYLDGHVAWVNRMPKAMLPPLDWNSHGPFMPYDDNTRPIVNYVDHGG